jgi:hypothetical protein
VHRGFLQIQVLRWMQRQVSPEAELQGAVTGIAFARLHHRHHRLQKQEPEESQEII